MKTITLVIFSSFVWTVMYTLWKLYSGALVHSSISLFGSQTLNQLFFLCWVFLYLAFSLKLWIERFFSPHFCCPPFWLIALSRLSINSISPFCTQFQLSALVRINWHALNQWVCWNFCMCIIRSEIMHMISNHLYDLWPKLHSTQFSYHFITWILK